MVVSQQMDVNQDSDYFNFKNPDKKEEIRRKNKKLMVLTESMNVE